MNLKSQNSFDVSLKQLSLSIFGNHSMLLKYYTSWNSWAQGRCQNIYKGNFRQLFPAKHAEKDPITIFFHQVTDSL